MRNHFPCFICGNPVLSIPGQDILCENYVLSPDLPLGQEADEQNMSGLCHLKCLINSQWGKLWAGSFVDHFSGIRKFSLLARMDDLVILYDRRFHNVLVVRDDGWITFTHPKDLSERVVTADGWLLPTKFWFIVEASKPEPEPLIVEKLKTQTLVFDEFVKIFGVYDRLLYPELIQQQALQIIEINRDQTWIKLRTECYEFVPKEIAEAIRVTLKLS
jgi:hypothetical protein